MSTHTNETYDTIVRDTYDRYRAGGPHPYGECQILAAIFCYGAPELVPVGGICTDGEDTGAHWWVETPQGHILDPLGDAWQGGGIQAREPRVRGLAALIGAMRRSWARDAEVMDMAARLEARLQGRAAA